MPSVQICHMRDESGFDAFRRSFEREHEHLQFGRFEIADGEATLCAASGGMKVFWLYAGEGEVFLRRGFRTKEGDAVVLSPEYVPDLINLDFNRCLNVLEARFQDIAPGAQPPVRAILDRRRGSAYVGDFANDLWKLEHVPEEWSVDSSVFDTIQHLFRLYRDQGYSTKTIDSYERIMEGDQLIVAGDDALTVRGSFACLTLENVRRSTSHIPAVMRLRYLKDSSGGCNFDFDPFRRLPLTWYANLPGEIGDGVNFVNSHVVNIAQETSPTHFHPPLSSPLPHGRGSDSAVILNAPGGGSPQNEFYLVLNPAAYDLDTYGRQARLVTYPDLRDLRRFEEHELCPGSFVFIPPGTGHRGIDVFVNVITIPGFKPRNEYYIDQDVARMAGDTAPYNKNLLALKNYDDIEDLLLCHFERSEKSPGDFSLRSQ